MNLSLRALSAALAMAMVALLGDPARADGAPPASTLRVVCSTALLAALTQQVGGTSTTVSHLIPWNMCPGHFDITPGQVETVRHADLFLCQGMERFVAGLVAKTTPGCRVESIRVPGNWLIPAAQKAAAARIAAVLGEARPGLKSTFHANLVATETEIARQDEEAPALRREFAHLRVLAAPMNRSYVEWLGLTVVGELPSDDNVSLGALSDLLAASRADPVRLVVDNLQSGGKVGRTVAGELGVPLVVLSNFPDPEVEHPCLALLQANVRKLRTVIARQNVNGHAGTR